MNIKRKMLFKQGGVLKKIEPVSLDVAGEQIVFFGNPTGSSENKFNRATMIASRYSDIVSKLLKIADENNNIPTNQDYNLSVALLTIIKTGIRIGNEDSAEGYYTIPMPNSDIPSTFVKTYGLTTMLKEHVQIENGLVQMKFLGKKHVENTFQLDEKLSKYVIPIIKSDYNPVFNITENDLTSFIKKKTSPYFSAKDFRTFRANVYAYQYAIGLNKPQTKKEWKENVKLTCEHVSKLLNNTHQVVKTSYVDPRLFDYLFGYMDNFEKKRLKK